MMKKFLFFLIILISLGSAVFFLGWPHLTVPPGSYGVMRSKTHGLENQVIRDGEFRWFWYKLIPTNVKISVYTLSPVKRAIKSSGNLPSGQVYAALAGLEVDFSWEISGELTFSIRPDCLPEFTSWANIADDAGLRKAEEDLALRIENSALRRLKAYADNDDAEKMESIFFVSSLPELEDEIQQSFPEIENLSCTIQTVRCPDYALFQSVKSLYHVYITRQNSVLSQEITKDAEKRIYSKTRLDELGQMGELLTRYPILMQYLTFEKDLAHD
jgi:hypothetical protein